MEFKPINTEEEFNAAVEERIKNAQAEVEQKYSDYETLKNQISEKDAKIHGYEIQSLRGRIANEMGLPPGCADFLTGEDEKSIKASAEGLKAIIGEKKDTPPLYSNEPSGNKVNTKTAALKKLLNGLKGE